MQYLDHVLRDVTRIGLLRPPRRRNHQDGGRRRPSGLGVALHPGARRSLYALDGGVLTSIQEGLFTVLFAFASYFLLPNAAETSYFLKEDEKQLIYRALHDDGILGDGEKKSRNWTEFGKTFVQPHIVLLAIAGFFSGMLSYNMAMSAYMLT